MRISARNQLKGTITAVTKGAVNGVVAISLGQGDATVKADITNEAIEALGLTVGEPAVAIIKATNVMFGVGDSPIAGISARNQLVGTIEDVREGAVNGHVRLALADGYHVMGSITNEAIKSLGLKAGMSAVAIVKATDVIVGVE